MANASYVALSQGQALLKRLDLVANNVANMSTAGFRREGTVFSEYVRQLDVNGEVLSLVNTTAGFTDLSQGALKQTGNSLDVGLEGDGWFLVASADGDRLTRDGRFSTNSAGELVTYDGLQVLDEGGASLFIPPDAKAISISRDGTISADGQPLGKLAVVEAPPHTLTREGSLLFRAEDGVTPVEDPRILQGFTEASNVNPVKEITQLIEVQRAYDQVVSLLESEDERIRGAITSIGRPA